VVDCAAILERIQSLSNRLENFYNIKLYKIITRFVSDITRVNCGPSTVAYREENLA